MEFPDWWYDDARQVGLDFEDAAQVASYDLRQGRSSADDRALLTRLSLGPDMAMADIGCGTGMLVCEAAAMCRSAVGVDISATMLAAASSRAGKLGLENVVWRRGGFLSFLAAELSFDLVTSKNALHHLPDFWKALAFTRIRAALKPGGRFYLRDVMFAEPPDRLDEAVEAWFDWLAANTGYSRAEAASHIREEHTTFTWVIERMLTDSGFRIIEHTQDGVYGAFVAERVK